jgi:hypothetical protein
VLRRTKRERFCSGTALWGTAISFIERVQNRVQCFEPYAPRFAETENFRGISIRQASEIVDRFPRYLESVRPAPKREQQIIVGENFGRSGRKRRTRGAAAICSGQRLLAYVRA